MTFFSFAFTLLLPASALGLSDDSTQLKQEPRTDTLEQTRHVGVVKSERPGLTDGEIIFEEF